MSMNNLAALREKILSIPPKRQRQDLVGSLRQYNEKAQKASGILRTVVNGRNLVSQVFPDGQFSESVDKVRQAARSAGNLLKKLEKDPGIIEKRSFDKLLAGINELALSSLGPLKIQWKKLVSGRIQAFAGLVAAAAEAKLEGSTDLENLLHSIEARMNEPPVSEEQAVSIRNDLDDLVKGVAALELEGPGGLFLIEAAKGAADPRALYEPEIRQFIEKFDLWRLLRVRLQ